MFLLVKRTNQVLLVFSAASGISPEQWLVFAQCVFQCFLTASSALEDQCEFSGSKVLAIELIKLASCEHFI